MPRTMVHPFRNGCYANATSCTASPEVAAMTVHGSDRPGERCEWCGSADHAGALHAAALADGVRLARPAPGRGPAADAGGHAARERARTGAPGGKFGPGPDAAAACRQLREKTLGLGSSGVVLEFPDRDAGFGPVEDGCGVSVLAALSVLGGFAPVRVDEYLEVVGPTLADVRAEDEAIAAYSTVHGGEECSAAGRGLRLAVEGAMAEE